MPSMFSGNLEEMTFGQRVGVVLLIVSFAFTLVSTTINFDPPLKAAQSPIPAKVPVVEQGVLYDDPDPTSLVYRYPALRATMPDSVLQGVPFNAIPATYRKVVEEPTVSIPTTKGTDAGEATIVFKQSDTF